MKIKVTNLAFSYENTPVLSGVNLDYDSRDFLVIIGPNGGGKSTFLKLLIGLLKPQSGKIEFDFGENGENFGRGGGENFGENSVEFRGENSAQIFAPNSKIFGENFCQTAAKISKNQTQNFRQNFAKNHNALNSENFAKNTKNQTQNFAKISPKISKLIGYVPQTIPNTKFFPMSVLDAVLMGRCDEKKLFFYSKTDKKIAMEALEKVAMADLAKRDINALSGGQRQRVYIARALASGARILMLDEPLSSLDLRSATQIYTLLLALNKSGVGVLMVSHDVAMAASFATQVAFVSGGLHLHKVSGQNRSEFIRHLAKNHGHFCDIEILSGECGCENCPIFLAK